MLNLFSPLVAEDKQHPIFQRLLFTEFSPERAVLTEWSDGFVDRDGKFVKEFQTSFESSMWELYVFACIKAVGGNVDFQHSAPDFVCEFPDIDVCIEATIAQPAKGGAPAFGPGAPHIPDDLDAFNVESTLRHCNRLSTKSDKFRNAYSSLAHVQGKPYVIALAPFDRPSAHLAANRPIMAALYGVYFDEAQTLSIGSDNVIQRPVDGIAKSPTADVPAAYFTDSTLAHVSAVLYSPIATWGKIRALAEAPDALTHYTTLHPNANSIRPAMRQAMKKDYVEHLLDGLYVLHNPFATHPLPTSTFSHERIAQLVAEDDSAMRFIAPDDFLLMRMLYSVGTT